MLRAWNPEYEETPENICEVMYGSLLFFWLTGKTVPEASGDPETLLVLRTALARMGKEELLQFLAERTRTMVKEFYDDDEELFGYLKNSWEDLGLRLRNAANSRRAERYFLSDGGRNLGESG